MGFAMASVGEADEMKAKVRSTLQARPEFIILGRKAGHWAGARGECLSTRHFGFSRFYLNIAPLSRRLAATTVLVFE